MAPGNRTRRDRSGWSKLRRKAIIRDQARCRHCGRREPYVDLEVHHIVPVKAGGKDKLPNLATLCKPCHLDAEGYISALKPIGETDVAGQPYREMQKRLNQLRSKQERQKSEYDELLTDGEKARARLREDVEKARARLRKIENRQAEQLPTLIPHESETEARKRWEEWNEADESTSNTNLTESIEKVASKLLFWK